MDVSLFNLIENFNYNLNLKFIFSEEIIIIFLTYNFIKLLIFSSIFEIIWPTHFFNKKNNFNSSIKFRNFNEVVLKLNNNYYFFKFFKNFFIKFYLK